jgi:uncharacterized protein involved in oxidation of intracellular sulfur
MSRFVVIVNDAPYGSERTFNALRTAQALARLPGAELRLFFFGDAVGACKSGQHVPAGHYSLEVMLHALVRDGAAVGC